MFIVGDEYNLWDRHPIWQQLKLALPIYHTDPFIVDEIAKAGSEFGLGTVLGRSNVYTYRTPKYMLRYTYQNKIPCDKKLQFLVQFRIFMVERLQARSMLGNLL